MARKILVVEDGKDMSEMITARLKSNKNYDVMNAKDGLEGLEMAGREMPDLILLDVKMPVMDGFTVLKNLKQDKKTRPIPVVMLTAFDKMKDLFKAEGVMDYIIKPFDGASVMERIKKILGE